MPSPSRDREKEEEKEKRLPELEPFNPACSELTQGRLRVLFQRAQREKMKLANPTGDSSGVPTTDTQSKGPLGLAPTTQTSSRTLMVGLDDYKALFQPGWFWDSRTRRTWPCTDSFITGQS